ncbi:hypothetical protein GCM10029976_055660 [Kribbella albertanoniae]
MKYLDRALRLELRRSVLSTDGPYAEAKEHCLSIPSAHAASVDIGGFGEGVLPHPVLRALPQVLVEERRDVGADCA